jgi:hypothetical protein
MHVKSISGTVTTTVVLGEGSYGDKLTVTSTGAVLPSAYGADAIYAAVSNAKLVNMGKIVGGVGAYGAGGAGGNGGIGVDLAGGGIIRNKNEIAGGAGGGASYPGHGGNGAAAIVLTLAWWPTKVQSGVGMAGV